MPSRTTPTHGRHRRRTSRFPAHLASRSSLLRTVPVAIAVLATTGACTFGLGAPPPLQPVQSLASQALGSATGTSTAPTGSPASTSPAATTTAATTTTPSTTSSPPSSTSSPPPTSSSPATTTSSGPTPPVGPTEWGSSVMAYGNETYQQAWDRVQQRLHPQVIRFFDSGTNGPSWPSRTGNAPLVISFKIPPAQVLDGSHDAQLRSFFAATPQKTFWTYWHEPEDDMARGAFTSAQYKDAWAHIAAIAKASGKPLVSTLILMGYTAKGGAGRVWTDYYAGPDVIDVLAWDCYAHGQNDTPQSVYGAARSVSIQANKPWAIAETGVGSKIVTDPAKRQAMLTAMSDYLATSDPKPVFVTYFDSDPDAPNIHYGWNISMDPDASAAWVNGEHG